MSDEPVMQRLSNKEYVTIVVRLLVGQTGQIWSGSVVDLYERPIGQFRGCHELPNLITRWLAHSDHDATLSKH